LNSFITAPTSIPILALSLPIEAIFSFATATIASFEAVSGRYALSIANSFSSFSASSGRKLAVQQKELTE
jgi:hypothetical protein